MDASIGLNLPSDFFVTFILVSNAKQKNYVRSKVHKYALHSYCSSILPAFHRGCECAGIHYKSGGFFRIPDGHGQEAGSLGQDRGIFLPVGRGI